MGSIDATSAGASFLHISFSSLSNTSKYKSEAPGHGLLIKIKGNLREKET